MAPHNLIIHTSAFYPMVLRVGPSQALIRDYWKINILCNVIGTPPGGIVDVICSPEAVQGRYLTIMKKTLENGDHQWSLFELDVFH